MPDRGKLGRSPAPDEGRVLSIEEYLDRPASVSYVRRDRGGVDRISSWPEGTTGASFEDAHLAFIAFGKTFGEEAAAAFRRITETVVKAVTPALRALAAQVSDLVESEEFRAWLRIFEEEQARRDRRKGLAVAFALVALMALLMGFLAVVW